MKRFAFFERLICSSMENKVIGSHSECMEGNEPVTSGKMILPCTKMLIVKTDKNCWMKKAYGQRL